MAKEKTKSNSSSEEVKNPTQPIENSNPQTGSSSQDAYKESHGDYLSGGLTLQYQELLKTEKKLKEINDKIKWYKEQLKPINRVDRKRGIKSSLTPTERQLNKAMLKKLETERVTENENWKIQYAAFSESSYEEIERTKYDRFVELGRSGYYAKKYSGSIVSRIKSLLENILNEDFEGLKKYKDLLSKSDKEKTPQLIHAILKENEENPFLSTFYISHKSLQYKYTKLILDLFTEWNERAKEEYSFKNSDIKLMDVDVVNNN